MSWIEQIDADDADGKLAEMYADLVRERGKGPSRNSAGCGRYRLRR